MQQSPYTQNTISKNPLPLFLLSLLVFIAVVVAVVIDHFAIFGWKKEEEKNKMCKQRAVVHLSYLHNIDWMWNMSCRTKQMDRINKQTLIHPKTFTPARSHTHKHSQSDSLFTNQIEKLKRKKSI